MSIKYSPPQKFFQVPGKKKIIHPGNCLDFLRYCAILKHIAEKVRSSQIIKKLFSPGEFQ
jgi:hypothetical protein